MTALYASISLAAYVITGCAVHDPKWPTRLTAINPYNSPSQPYGPVLSYSTSVDDAVVSSPAPVVGADGCVAVVTAAPTAPRDGSFATSASSGCFFGFFGLSFGRAIVNVPAIATIAT